MFKRFKPGYLTVLVVLSGLFFLASCKKETSNDGSNEAQELEASKASNEGAADGESVFGQFFDDAYGANDEVGLAGTGVFWGRTDTMTPVPHCYTVTIHHLSTTNPFPVEIIVDFGTTGCVGPDGHVRKGKIITLYTNRLIIPGAVATTTFDNFFMDGIKVEGTHKITNIGSPVNAIPLVRKFEVNVIDGKLTKPDGNWVEWNSTKIITQIDGLITPLDPRDDAFKIEGSARGRTRRGALLVAWESTITEPLIRRFSCRWIVRGRIKTVRINTNTTGPWVAYLDFGNGVCDNLAMVTINGVSFQITLR